jgi:hypothetical protein
VVRVGKFLMPSIRLVLRRYFRHLFGKDISSTGYSMSVLLIIDRTNRNVLSRFFIWLSLKFLVYCLLLSILLLLLWYCKQNRDDSPYESLHNCCHLCSTYLTRYLSFGLSLCSSCQWQQKWMCVVRTKGKSRLLVAVTRVTCALPLKRNSCIT